MWDSLTYSDQWIFQDVHKMCSYLKECGPRRTLVLFSCVLINIWNGSVFNLGRVFSLTDVYWEFCLFLWGLWRHEDPSLYKLCSLRAVGSSSWLTQSAEFSWVEFQPHFKSFTLTTWLVHIIKPTGWYAYIHNKDTEESCRCWIYHTLK